MDTDDCTRFLAGGELVGELDSRDDELLELVELDLDRLRDGDRLEVLPAGEGVLEPDRDFVLLLVDLDDFIT